jgi:hypothetical protein
MTASRETKRRIAANVAKLQQRWAMRSAMKALVACIPVIGKQELLSQPKLRFEGSSRLRSLFQRHRRWLHASRMRQRR